MGLCLMSAHDPESVRPRCCTIFYPSIAPFTLWSVNVFNGRIIRVTVVKIRGMTTIIHDDDGSKWINPSIEIYEVDGTKKGTIC